MTRAEIRQAIIIMTQNDPQENFRILEEKDNVVKVEVLWVVGEAEVLEIKLRDN